MPPKGYDIIDNSIQVYKRQFISRRRIYKRNKYKYNMHKVFDYHDTTAEELITQYINKEPVERKQPKVEDFLKGTCLLDNVSDSDS